MLVNMTTQEVPKLWLLALIIQAYKPKGMNCKKVPLMWVTKLIS
jgi:hypothetical protein